MTVEAFRAVLMSEWPTFKTTFNNFDTDRALRFLKDLRAQTVLGRLPSRLSFRWIAERHNIPPAVAERLYERLRALPGRLPGYDRWRRQRRRQLLCQHHADGARPRHLVAAFPEYRNARTISSLVWRARHPGRRPSARERRAQQARDAAIIVL